MINKFFGKYRFLSNFYRCEVKYGEIIYPTVEHAYQAAKFVNPLDCLKILAKEKPGEAKREAWKMKAKVRRDWDSIKIEVMRELLEQKFAKEPFKTWLKRTGNRQLIEGNTWNDVFWGVCNGKGENNLGKLLMEIRNKC